MIRPNLNFRFTSSVTSPMAQPSGRATPQFEENGRILVSPSTKPVSFAHSLAPNRHAKANKELGLNELPEPWKSKVAAVRGPNWLLCCQLASELRKSGFLQAYQELSLYCGLVRLGVLTTQFGGTWGGPLLRNLAPALKQTDCVYLNYIADQLVTALHASTKTTGPFLGDALVVPGLDLDDGVYHVSTENGTDQYVVFSCMCILYERMKSLGCSAPSLAPWGFIK